MSVVGCNKGRKGSCSNPPDRVPGGALTLPPMIPLTQHGEGHLTTDSLVTKKTTSVLEVPQETTPRTASSYSVISLASGSSRIPTSQPVRNETLRDQPTSSGELAASSISVELMIVSAVAGLGFLVAIIALAFAYQARRRGGNDEKNNRSNDKTTAVYRSVGRMPGNSFRDSTADNPTYAEIGDHLLSGMTTTLPGLSSSIPQSHGKQRLGSATLPLLSHLDYREGISSPPPEKEIYDEPDLLVISRSKTLAHVRYGPNSKEVDGYLEPKVNYHSRATMPQPGRGEPAYLELLPDIPRDIRSDYTVPRPIKNAQSTESLSSFSATYMKDKGNYSLLTRENQLNKKEDTYVDVDYPQKKTDDFPCSSYSLVGSPESIPLNYSEECPKHIDNAYGDGRGQMPTAPPTYFTLGNDQNHIDGNEPNPNENQVYFTLENENSSQKDRDTCQDLNPESSLKINTSKQEYDIPKRPNELSENPKPASHERPLYIECVQETCDTLSKDSNEDSATLGYFKENGADPSYQRIPLSPPIQDDPNLYQKLNRGFMEQTLKR